MKDKREVSWSKIRFLFGYLWRKYSW